MCLAQPDFLPMLQNALRSVSRADRDADGARCGVSRPGCHSSEGKTLRGASRPWMPDSCLIPYGGAGVVSQESVS